MWEQNLRILTNQGDTKDWVHLLSLAVLTMNSQESSSTGYTPDKVFHGRRHPFSRGLKEPRRGQSGA